MLSHIPPWVLLILGLLVYVGFRQSRPRELAPPVALGLAAGMAALSLAGVFSAFGPSPLALASWLIGMSTAITLGLRLVVPQGMRFVPARGRVFVPGSWLPLALMLGIFAVKFLLGFAAGVGAPVPAASPAGVIVALVLGLLSGAFSARGLAVRRIAGQARLAP